MYLWEPVPDQAYILYIICGAWAFAGATWLSQIVAVYTVFYAETDSSAMTKYCLWKAVGALVTYGYASCVSIDQTLIILFASLTFSMIYYGLIEIGARRKARAKLSLMTIDDC